jgi:hypothetical protein
VNVPEPLQAICTAANAGLANNPEEMKVIAKAKMEIRRIRYLCRLSGTPRRCFQKFPSLKKEHTGTPLDLKGNQLIQVNLHC